MEFMSAAFVRCVFAPLDSRALLAPSVFLAQTQQSAEQKQGMGVSTGAARSYTSRRTAGNTDPKAPMIFEDVTARTALANFRHRSGGPEKNYIVEVPRAVLRFSTMTATVARTSTSSTARPLTR